MPRVKFFATTLLIGILLTTSTSQMQAQTRIYPEDSLQRFRGGRLALVCGGQAAVATATLIGLNELWYKDYPRSGFHFFNDNAEWLGMDKWGHAYTAYQTSHLGYAVLRWSGVKESKAAWYSCLTGIGYQLIVEMLDGFSDQWGFSVGDLSANLAGAALFTTQQVLWKDQKILLKYSFHSSEYARYRPSLLGNNFPERVLKDYNGQTAWLSISPGAFLKDQRKFPPWLCISLGMGAEGMISARKPDPILSYYSLPRGNRLFLSLDLDLSKIPVRNKTLHSILSVLNVLKLPFPALEYSFARHRMRGHWMYL